MAKTLDVVPKIKTKINQRDLNFEPSFEPSKPGLKPQKHNRPAGSKQKPALNRGETFVCPQGWLITCHFVSNFLKCVSPLSQFVLYLCRLMGSLVSLYETLVEPDATKPQKCLTS